MAKGKKTGGRQKGTPNKDNPLKDYLRAHSIKFFEPKEQVDEETGQKFIASDFDIAMAALAPDDLVAAELKLLEFHTPKMKAVEVDMDVHGTVHTIEDTLKELCGETDEDD
ncbi:MAG: hypothetical protein NC039_07575 [Muribaculaceae bacterium]|nr:hypothetical protein [Muribaculaceae bacterium]